MEKHLEIEKSIIKKYRKEIWKKFTAAIVQYELIRKGDHIAVCLSGGKDSMLLAKCMQEIQKHGKFFFELEFLVMDPGYNPENRQRILDNAALLNLPIQIFETEIFGIVAETDRSPCYLCAKMRRGHLYSRAKELGCNKIALGHHFDDMIETVLLSLLYGGEIKTMMPKLHSTNFEGMELIRPLYLVKEEDIVRWARYNALSFIQCACRFTENDFFEDTSKREEMKALIQNFRKINPYIDQNIFASMGNVNLNAVIGYVKQGRKYSFLDDYDN